MKNAKKYIKSVLLALAIFIYANNAFAFVYPAGPVFDPLNVSGESAGTFATAGSKILNAQTTINTRITNAKKALAEKIAGILGGKRKPGKTPGAKKIVESDFVSYYDEGAIKEKIYELFWTYPQIENEDAILVENAYKTKSKEFYQDNLIEVWASVRAMETELEQIRTEQASLKEQIIKEDQEGEQLGINELWKNAYEAYKNYDALYALIEELTAMKAQLIGAKSITNDVKPSYKIEVQSNLIIYKKELAFASQDTENTSQKISFQDAPVVTTSPVAFKNSQNKLSELTKFEPVYASITKALEYHNLLQSLPRYKEVFMTYEQMKALHNKSKEMLDLADKCAIDYLSRYYNNPQIIWMGRDMGTQNNEHHIRDGISGWAYNGLYVAAKQKELEETQTQYTKEDALDGSLSAKPTQLNAQNLISEELNTIHTSPEMTINEEGMVIADNYASETTFDDEAQQKEVENTKQLYQKDENAGFSSQQDKEDAQKNTRRQNKIYWDIGSYVIKDLLKNPQAWQAQIKNNQDLWYDNKVFYTQYINKKYDNIEAHLTQYLLSSLTDKAKAALSKDKSGITQALFDASIAKFQDDGKEKIQKYINEAKEKINNMDYKEFNAQNHQAFAKIHKEMFEDIKKIELNISSLSSGSILGTYNLLTELLTSAQVQASDYEVVDDQYFVGKDPSTKDFKTPKQLPQEVLPSPREIIYFDEVDWANSGGKTNSVSKQNFYNRGEYIPKIWELMLKDNGFVETDFDINLAIKQNPASKDFARGGRYPCIFENFVVDYQDKYIIKTASQTNKESYPTCTYENAIKRDILGYMVYAGDYKELATLATNDDHLNKEVFNLGAFLSANNSFSELPQSVFAQIDKEKNEQSVDSIKETHTRHMKNQMPYKINQIGDFLRVADEERELKKSVDEINAQIKTLKWGEQNSDGTQKSEGLYDKLKNLGYEISDEFSLANELDYKTAKDLLQTAKDDIINNTLISLDMIDSFENTLAQERKDDYNNILQSLIIDENAYISLGTTPPSKAQLIEDIKQEEIVSKANAKYQKEGDDAMAKALEDFALPYCAAY